MSRDQKEQEAKAAQIYRDLKAMLKSKGKNELIKMIFEQINIYQELQHVSKQLHQENQQLKAAANPAAPEAAQPTEAT